MGVNLNDKVLRPVVQLLKVDVGLGEETVAFLHKVLVLLLVIYEVLFHRLYVHVEDLFVSNWFWNMKAVVSLH